MYWRCSLLSQLPSVLNMYCCYYSLVCFHTLLSAIVRMRNTPLEHQNHALSYNWDVKKNRVTAADLSILIFQFTNLVSCHHRVLFIRAESRNRLCYSCDSSSLSSCSVPSSCLFSMGSVRFRPTSLRRRKQCFPSLPLCMNPFGCSLVVILKTVYYPHLLIVLLFPFREL